MSIALSCTALRARFRRFGRDQRGVSAIEFALLAPLMIALYLGGVEISQAFSIDRKVSMTARTVADLVSRVSEVKTTAEMDNILDAATAVASPYPAGKLKVTVSSLSINNTGVVRVEWSRARNTTPRSAGQIISTLPTGLNTKNTYLIWAEVEYGYEPAIGYVLTGTLTLKDQIYMRPRLSDRVLGPA